MGKLKLILKKISQNDFSSIASSMAFNFIFAIPPFLIFLISVFGLMGSESAVNNIVFEISSFTPSQITAVIEGLLKKIISSSSLGLLTVGFLISVWSTSNAVEIIFKSMNKVYNVTESRSFLKLKLRSVVVVFVVTILMFISANFIIFGESILNLAEYFFSLPGSTKDYMLLVRWPISFICLFIMSAFIYFVSPNIKEKFSLKLLSIIPGSIFFCIVWLVGSWFFSFYVQNFDKYNKSFGTIGAMLIFLTWLYLSSFIILIGGAINSVYFQKKSPN